MHNTNTGQQNTVRSTSTGVLRIGFLSFCSQSDILNNCKYCQGDFVFHKQVTMSDMSLLFIILLLQQTSVPPVSVDAQTPRFVPVKINDQMCYPLFKCIHFHLYKSRATEEGFV